MPTVIYFNPGVTHIPENAPSLPLLKFIYLGDPATEVETDNGEPYLVEESGEESGLGQNLYAKLTSLQTGNTITFKNETKTGYELGMNIMVEKIEHFRSSIRYIER